MTGDPHGSISARCAFSNDRCRSPPLPCTTSPRTDSSTSASPLRHQPAVRGDPVFVVAWKVNAALQSWVSASAMSTAGGDLAKGFRRWRQDGGYGGNVPPLHDTHGTIPSVVRRQRFRRNGFAHFVLGGSNDQGIVAEWLFLV